MKFLNKLISFILCFMLIFNSCFVAYGAELVDGIQEVHLYSVPVESNEYSKEYVSVYEFDGKYYLNLEDVKEFTRCTLTENEKTITLTHGLREIVIDKVSGNMMDSELVDQGNISLLEYNGKYLCEGIPMLNYLGATCAINQYNKLEVLMPAFTIWESIMPDYVDYYFNISELYGGEDNVKISLICDIIADVLDGVSGHGLMANADTHLEDALYEVLNVDMMKYESVKEIATAQNQKINDFLSSAVFGTSLETADNMYDAVYEALDYYSKFYISAKNDILLDAMSKTDDFEYASELASQIKEQVYAQSATKANLKTAKKAQSFIDIGMLAFDTAITSYSMMQYNDDTKNVFARTINQEMFEYANYHDISWNNVSDKISNTLKSTQSIVANTAIDNVTEFAVEKVTEEGAKKALSAFTSKANIYATAIQIGSFVASLLNYELNQAYSADMNAIWLSTVQYDIAMLASSLLVREGEDTKFTNAESLEKLKDIFTLYYRTTIAFSENIAKSIEEFGTKSNQKWVPWFSSTTEDSVASYMAEYLYRITNCEIVPVVKYSELLDNVIFADWIEKYKVEKTEDIFGKNDAELIWNEFLKTGDYITYTKDWDVSSLEYAIADINLDMIPELLIQATDSPDFFNTWLFALEKKEIVLVTEIYGYGQFRYSQNQNAVIGSPEWKPFGGTGYSPFYKLEGTKLEFVFEIIQDEGIFYYSDSVGTKEINEDERKQFFSDVSYFEWESIQTLNSNVDSQNKLLEVANKYAIAMTEGWDMYQLNDAGLNYVCAYYTNEQIGYTYMDIDCNGVEELIIGSIDSRGYIFDMYTLVDGEIKQVLSSMERDGYYLSSDGSIINDGSGSAIQTGFRRYIIDSDGYTLKLVEGVVYDGYYAEEIGLVNDTSKCSEDNSYFKFGSDEKYIHISAQEAQQRRNIFMDKENYMDLECIPFSEYK